MTLPRGLVLAAAAGAGFLAAACASLAPGPAPSPSTAPAAAPPLPPPFPPLPSSISPDLAAAGEGRAPLLGPTFVALLRPAELRMAEAAAACAVAGAVVGSPEVRAIWRGPGEGAPGGSTVVFMERPGPAGRACRAARHAAVKGGRLVAESAWYCPAAPSGGWVRQPGPGDVTAAASPPAARSDG